ncbi:oxytocin receptor isoform X1 [Callorhinchus milii]|uniref:Oxytocin receptor n=1 Tax=Callorhinchus milii TaxID=7868 RepID=H3K0J0_CALMI|nr:oxytocin receptor [Callorhinchus milii]XP_007888663.1 oxytocin receptor isoform X1 [Callorhinchus milii]XP_007888664.1 oxytocin receptor isoform X1 [Callorhinchus milii]BAL63078.1 oxytocin receptor [Callorhinchus milii]|eukprot:gi/632946654/ref/XP_007888663.1/ PREDICTED: oxytocin receptor [Callorhinchus milii]
MNKTCCNNVDMDLCVPNASANGSALLENWSRFCNSSADLLKRNETVAKVEVTLLAVILILALTGNIAVLLAIHSNRHKPSRMYFFVKHLSIADLVVAVFQVLPQLIWEITFRFHGPDFLCRIVKYLQIVGMFASTYLLIVMSIDRCLTICQPLKSLHQRSNSMYVISSWVISLAFSIPQIFIFSFREVGPEVYDCWADFIQPWGAKAYITWITVSVYIIPVLILTVCYGLISFKIWQNVKLKTRRETKTPQGGSMLARVSSIKIISRAKIRTVKMTFVIVLAYIICWTPFFYVQMWTAWDPHAPKEDLPFVLAMLLASLNSCCNPWIYMFFTGRLFQDLMHRFLCCSLLLAKPEPASGEITYSKKSNSSTFALSLKSSGSQKSIAVQQQQE